MQSINLLIGVVILAAGANAAVGDPTAMPSSHSGNSASDDTRAYVGTYTGEGRGQGIYLFRTPRAAASREQPRATVSLAAEIKNPSFLAVDPKRGLLFAVSETDAFEGQRSGAVSAFAIDAATGKLTLLNRRASRGTGPCHLVLDATGRNLVLANYNSGSVAVFPVQADGRLGEATDFVQHAGKSIDPKRQQGPHAHCVTLDAANHFVFVCDLGLDQILTYRFDAERGKLTPGDPAFTSIKAGSGPRHMVFRPDGRFAYVISEMSSTITVFSYAAERGRLTELQTISTLPPGFEGKSSCAEIAVLPSGRFLYASNRGSDTLARFEIDPATGMLKYAEAQPTGGKTPRHFGLEPAGDRMAVANQDSNTVFLCKIDAVTGQLQPVGGPTEIPSPVCVIFMPPAESSR